MHAPSPLNCRNGGACDDPWQPRSWSFTAAIDSPSRLASSGCDDSSRGDSHGLAASCAVNQRRGRKAITGEHAALAVPAAVRASGGAQPGFPSGGTIPRLIPPRATAIHWRRTLEHQGARAQKSRSRRFGACWRPAADTASCPRRRLVVEGSAPAPTDAPCASWAAGGRLKFRVGAQFSSSADGPCSPKQRPGLRRCEDAGPPRFSRKTGRLAGGRPSSFHGC